MACPDADFDEIDEDIQKIVNTLPKKQRDKIIKWLNELLDERYQLWEMAMGEDL